MDPYKILAVDDEAINLKALERSLRRDYKVFSAINGEDALAIMEQEDITLVVADQRMPGMTGIELLKKIMREYPNTIRVILTAYTDKKLLMDAINVVHVYAYLAKPWEPEEVRAVVRKGIEAYETNRASMKLHTRALLGSKATHSDQSDDTLRPQANSRKTLGEILVEHRVISRNQLEAAMKLQESERRLGDALIQRRVVSRSELKAALDLQLEEILVDLGYADREDIRLCRALMFE
jgi:response regulator RpfG family c-di-GMP phosphodiesterase